MRVVICRGAEALSAITGGFVVFEIDDIGWSELILIEERAEIGRVNFVGIVL